MSKNLEFLKFFGFHPRPLGGTAGLSNSIIAQVEQKAVNRSDLNLLHRSDHLPPSLSIAS